MRYLSYLYHVFMTLLSDPFVFACLRVRITFGLCGVYGSTTTRQATCWIEWVTASPTSKLSTLAAKDGAECLNSFLAQQSDHIVLWGLQVCMADGTGNERGTISNLSTVGTENAQLSIPSIDRHHQRGTNMWRGVREA